jgi:hypothetical protein
MVAIGSTRLHQLPLIARAPAREALWPADRLERWPIDRLIPCAKNSRTHSEAQIAAGPPARVIACRRGSVGAAGVNTAGAPLARPPHPMRAPRSPPEPAGLQNLLPSKQCVSHRLIFFDCFSKRAHLRRPGRANPLDPSADQGSVDRQDHGRESGVSRHARAGPQARRAGALARARAHASRRGSVRGRLYGLQFAGLILPRIV